MEYKLIAVDIDGTLLNSQYELTAGTREAIEELTDKGRIFTVSTGRPTQGIDFLRDVLDFDLDFPIISYNGSMVVLSKSKQILYEEKLACEYVIKLEELSKHQKTNMIAWKENRLYMTEENAHTMEYQAITGIQHTLINSFRDIAEGGVTKAIWIDEPNKVSRMQTETQSALGEKINCHTSRAYLLEFVSKSASKAIGMEKIGEYFGIRQSEMIAVGDGYNDISMIQYAGLGVAMGNAPDDIKAIADYVAPTNDEDGLAVVIHQFMG